jgi:anti-anti-sigma regulatory factor
VEAHIHWESTADRVFSTMGLSALCGYQRDALPSQLLADLAAVHPAANELAGEAPFHLFGEEGNLILSGEIDLFSSDALDRALGFARDGDAPITLDLGALDFIDHHGLEVLAAHAHDPAGGGYEVRNRPPVVDRLCGLLQLELRS